MLEPYLCMHQNSIIWHAKACVRCVSFTTTTKKRNQTQTAVDLFFFGDGGDDFFGGDGGEDDFLFLLLPADDARKHMRQYPSHLDFLYLLHPSTLHPRPGGGIAW